MLFSSGNAAAMKNPAAVYCQEMGYSSQIKKTPSGEMGVCIVNGKEYEEWAFFTGKIGKEHSYCEKNGYDTITKSDGKGLASKDYAVCVPKKIDLEKRTAQSQQEIPMHKLMNLEEKLKEPIELPSIELIQEPISKRAVSTKKRALSTTPQSIYPASFSWLDNNGNYMTPVKNQAPYGLCQTFASVGAIESMEKIIKQNPSINPDLAEQEIPCKGVIDYHGGEFPEVVLRYVKENGIVEESVLPYVGPSSSCEIPANAKRHFITDARAIQSPWPLDSAQKRELVKQALIEKGPLIATMDISGGYFDENEIYKNDSPDALDHAVVLVGYNDTGDIHTSYYVAKNSWGELWNNNGYFKIGWDWNYNEIFYDQCRITSYSPLYVEVPKPDFLSSTIKGLQILTGRKVENPLEADANKNNKIELQDAIINLQKAAELRPLF